MVNPKNIPFTYRQYLMCLWLIDGSGIRFRELTSWEDRFLRSMIKTRIGSKITHKQDFHMWRIYEQKRRPKEYYASTIVEDIPYGYQF